MKSVIETLNLLLQKFDLPQNIYTYIAVFLGLPCLSITKTIACLAKHFNCVTNPKLHFRRSQSRGSIVNKKKFGQRKK